VGEVLRKSECVNSVLEVKRVSDRIVSLKLKIEVAKQAFWCKLDEVVEGVPRGERLVGKHQVPGSAHL